MENRKPKVVFTFVEAGMGHIIPMEGMYNAFKAKYGDKCEVVKSYVFSESKNPEVKKMGEALSSHTKRAMKNKFYNKLEAFSYLLSSKTTLKILDRHFRKAHKPFFEELKALNPDLIVSSYYKPSHLAHLSNLKGYTNTLIATYTPDPYVYPAWDRNCDLFLVNNSWAYRTAVNKGFNKDLVKQIPFVFKDTVTGLEMTKQEVHLKIGIDNGKYTVLFTNGAYGAKDNLKTLNKILKENLDINLIVVCGKNNELLSSLENLKGEQMKTNLIVVGFTDKLAEYMRASDLIVGKSGMNTPMEAVYLDCPMIICAEASRLEELTTKFYVQEKLAVRELNVKKIVEIIKKASLDKDMFNEHRKNFVNYRIDNGADVASDYLYELLKTRFNQL